MLESKVSKAIKRMKPILKELPKKKIKHSINVANELKDHNKTAIYAALGHDYLERGGNLEELIDHLILNDIPLNVIRIIKALSQDDHIDSENEPLTHISHELSQLHNDDIKNTIILIKLSDRLDNIKKKLRTGKLTKKYIKKSINLCDFLSNEYTGSDAIFYKLIRKLSKYLNL